MYPSLTHLQAMHDRMQLSLDELLHTLKSFSPDIFEKVSPSKSHANDTLYSFEEFGIQEAVQAQNFIPNHKPLLSSEQHEEVDLNVILSSKSSLKEALHELNIAEATNQPLDALHVLENKEESLDTESFIIGDMPKIKLTLEQVRRDKITFSTDLVAPVSGPHSLIPNLNPSELSLNTGINTEQVSGGTSGSNKKSALVEINRDVLDELLKRHVPVDKLMQGQVGLGDISKFQKNDLNESMLHLPPERLKKTTYAILSRLSTIRFLRK